MRVQRGQQAGAAGVPGQSRAEDSGGVCDCRRTATDRLLLHWRLQEQGGVLHKANHNHTESRIHEREFVLRGPVLCST